MANWLELNKEFDEAMVYFDKWAVSKMKKEFIHKWSMWWFLQKQGKELTQAFEKELNCIIIESNKTSSIDFTIWMNKNYCEVDSVELKKSMWINIIENNVLTHGSDYHYTKLIKEHGKTIEELYDLFTQIK